MVHAQVELLVPLALRPKRRPRVGCSFDQLDESIGRRRLQIDIVDKAVCRVTGSWIVGRSAEDEAVRQVVGKIVLCQEVRDGGGRGVGRDGERKAGEDSDGHADSTKGQHCEYCHVVFQGKTRRDEPLC